MCDLTDLNQAAPRMAADLSGWFAACARDLPWRERYDPYRVWVAEIMLQQTTAAACVPYFRRFITQFPSLTHLANAQEQDVLSAWEGLGYYSRARHLLQAARVIVTSHQGRVPESLPDLRSLPGIGPYTAGAIRAIAFNQPSPMVDANVRRVLGRVLAIPAGAEGAEKTIAHASLLLSQSGEPRVVNQALMELGATLCLPAGPKCADCPLAAHCGAVRAGRFDWYGCVSRKAPPEPVQEVCVLASHHDGWLVARPRDGRWRGLWEFPRARVEAGGAVGAAERLMAEEFRASFDGLRLLGTLRHRVTRFDITVHVVCCSLSGPPQMSSVEWRLVEADQIAKIPMPSPMRRIARRYVLSAEAPPQLTLPEYKST